MNLLELVAVLIAGAVIFVLGGARSFVAWSVVGVVVIGLVLLEALRRTRLRRQTPRSS